MESMTASGINGQRIEVSADGKERNLVAGQRLAKNHVRERTI
jgi:hypothetical protein